MNTINGIHSYRPLILIQSNATMTNGNQRKKYCIIFCSVFERAFLEIILTPGALGVSFRCITIHITSCLLVDDSVIRHVRTAWINPRAGLLIIVAKRRLQATHIIWLKMQVQCYQCSMIVSRVVLFTSMVNTIGFEFVANNLFYIVGKIFERVKIEQVQIKKLKIELLTVHLHFFQVVQKLSALVILLTMQCGEQQH